MSNTQWEEDSHPGYRTKTLKRGNCTIVVLRPILTEPERVKREREVENVLARCKSLASH